METILILAPFGKDAILASTLLEKEGYETLVLDSIEDVCHQKIKTSGALIITEEALSTQEYLQLQSKLDEQETWSDLPIILLVSNKEKKDNKIQKILDQFTKGGNISLLERPFHLTTLMTAINVALRARRRQYLVKELLVQQEVSLRSRDEFLSIASHELKTPITSLKLQVQMRRRFMNRGDPSVYTQEKVNSLIETAEHQVERLERLVDDMLDIAKIENGKLTLHFETFDLGDLVAKTYHSLQDEFKNAKCPVELNIVEGIIGHWDRYRIEQVVINLLTNAIKYGALNKIRIDVKSTRAKAIIIVKDSGIGIAPDDQSRIFQRFERAVVGGNISGMGLGLYITKEIIEMHGGSISVESKIGSGSAFTVELPIDKQ